jgi:DNA-directed RNA polymerase specialized sigma24 family protein
MGLFTSFRESMQRGEAFELSKEQMDGIMKDAFIIVGKSLRRKFPGGRVFGEETGDDLTQEMMIWLTEALRGCKPFPNRVTDFKSLCFAITDKACKRASDRWRTRWASETGRATLHGGSGVGRASGEPVSAQALASVADSERRGSPAVEEADAAAICEEVCQAAVDDLLALQDGKIAAVTAFRMRIGKGATALEIAESLGTSPSTVNRYLNKSEFCLMRAMEVAKTQLKEEFAEEAEIWESELEKAGRK